jgi:hypothetical protein
VTFTKKVLKWHPDDGIHRQLASSIITWIKNTMKRSLTIRPTIITFEKKEIGIKSEYRISSLANIGAFYLMQRKGEAAL